MPKNQSKSPQANGSRLIKQEVDHVAALDAAEVVANEFQQALPHRRENGER